MAFDEGDGGGGRVEVIGETARLALLRLEVVFHKAGRTALGTEQELMEGMQGRIEKLRNERIKRGDRKSIMGLFRDDLGDEVLCVSPLLY